MRITALTAKNFKTLEDISIKFENNYCAISGINNSGKSSLIKLILNLLYSGERPWTSDYEGFDFIEDKTQWCDQEEISVEYCLDISKNDDPSLVLFIEKIANISLGENESICIKYIIDSTGSKNIEATIQKIRIEEQAAREIANKLKTSKLLFLHNSTMSSDDNYFVSRGRLRSFYQVMLSDEEQKSLYSARKTVAQKVQQLAKHHKSDLSSLLGRLSEKYDVEFSSIESFSSKHVPFIINLKDKKVQIPLTEWGSGTQNRTQILMSILQAKSIKEQGDPKDKITPIVIVEEPESFLHPSAQSEWLLVIWCGFDVYRDQIHTK